MGYQARSVTTQVETLSDFQGFIGTSPAITSIYQMIKNAASSSATVFITGESGTGKELCAEALHTLSTRSQKPFIALNCAALQRDILESELFGHVKGAYTGAYSDRKGAVLLADGGTLFLDEICEMEVSLQSKLLRFLQTRQVQRLGDDMLRSVDIRIICATNRDPVAEVKSGRFREDLFYRLHVVPMHLPPLRARRDDTVAIAMHFLTLYGAEDGKDYTGFSCEAERYLAAYNWPGNIRELQNVIRNIVVMQSGGIIELENLPYSIQQNDCLLADRLNRNLSQMIKTSTSGIVIQPLEIVIRKTIEFAIAQFDGNIPRAAAALDVAPSTLYRKIQIWQNDGKDDTDYQAIQ